MGEGDDMSVAVSEREVVVDFSAVGDQTVRKGLSALVERLSSEVSGLSLVAGDLETSLEGAGAAVLLGDLARLNLSEFGVRGPHGRTKPRVLALLRTSRDWNALSKGHRWPADHVSYLFLSETSRPSARAWFEQVEAHLRDLLQRFEPDVVCDAAFAQDDGVLWVEFGDGLKRAIPWEELSFSRTIDSEPVSASPSPHQDSIVVSCEDGREFEVDGAALRSTLEPSYRKRLSFSTVKLSERVGETLRGIREDANLTQEELAERSDLDQATLSRIETGKREPRLSTLKKLAQGLGVALPSLLSRLSSQS